MEDIMADTEVDATGSLKAGSPSSRPDLTKSETIKRLYETYYSQKKRAQEPWIASYAAILRDVRNASVQELSTPEFQRRLWVDNPVSSTGACPQPSSSSGRLWQRGRGG